MKKPKHNLQALYSLSKAFDESLKSNGINAEISINGTGRLFTETMYNSKYHFSQINAPVYSMFGNDDFNILLCTNGNSVELFNIAVTVQGNGLGTEILNYLLDAADKCGVRINLNAVPTILTQFLDEYHLNNKLAGAERFMAINEELTKGTDRLIGYYETLGFQSFGKPFQMIYIPQK
jgi:GNAT superfamily N-acetyltransferase